MSLQSLCLLLIVIFSLSVCASPAASGVSNQFSAYDILESYGFPEGLLPKTVKGYTLDTNGRFTLNLDGSCRYNIPDSYPVLYSSKIRGVISSNRLRDLRGISVRVLFIWWDINAISVSGGELVFKVGPFSASYAITNFSENPICLGRVDEFLTLV